MIDGPRIECAMIGEFFGLDADIPECRGCSCCGTSESDRCSLHARTTKMPQELAANATLSERIDELARRAGRCRTDQTVKPDRRSRLIMLELIRGSDQDLAEEAGKLAAELRRPGLS